MSCRIASSFSLTVALALACACQSDARPAGHASKHELPADAGGSRPADAAADDAAVPDARTLADANGASASDAAAPADFRWSLPAGFPQPAITDDNPMSTAKVELGHRLFYDVRLSDNQTYACASCHKQSAAFTDGLPVSLGSTGSHTPRNAMMLANVAYGSSLTWANPLQTELARQARIPLLGDDPVELGIRSAEEIEARLRDAPEYPQLFAEAFPADPQPVSLQNLLYALEAFERTLISGHSALDCWLNDGEASALSASAKRGYQLFNSEKLECFHCHQGFAFTDHINYDGKAFLEMPFHNTGLYNIDGHGAYPEPNTGVYSVTGNPADMGKFKAPSLRNVALTGPYMHDGSIATLSEVLDHYAAGGRTIKDGPNAGEGSKSPLKDPLIRGFQLSDQERADVIAFLESLTDPDFLTNPDFADPFQ